MTGVLVLGIEGPPGHITIPFVHVSVRHVTPGEDVKQEGREQSANRREKSSFERASRLWALLKSALNNRLTISTTTKKGGRRQKQTKQQQKNTTAEPGNGFGFQIRFTYLFLSLFVTRYLPLLFPFATVCVWVCMCETGTWMHI